MSIWILLQVIINLLLFLGIAILWLRLRRPPKEDPRLSRGLQLLQSKITILEDLSDRTDHQVKQLSLLLDQKARHIQSKIFEAEKSVQNVEQSMTKSLEVAEIFQDKIPHKEIIERQNTVKYVRAAQLAHQGASVDEILRQVELPREQIEFIAKVNREELMFNADELPEWAKGSLGEDGEVKGGPATLFPAFEPPPVEYQSLKRLNQEFKDACADYDQAQIRAEQAHPVEEKAAQFLTAAKRVTEKIVHSANELLHPRPELEIEMPGAEAARGPALSSTVNSTPAAAPVFHLEQPMAAAPRPAVPTAPAAPSVPATPPKPSLSPMGTRPATAEVRRVQFPRIDTLDLKK